MKTKKKDHTCGCKVRPVGHDFGSSSCEVASFRPLRPREIMRLHTRFIRTPEDAARVIKDVSGVDFDDKEHVVAIGIDRFFRVVAVTDGSSRQTSICKFRVSEMIDSLTRYGRKDWAEEFQNSSESVQKSARQVGPVHSIVMGHNHPSGDAQASPADITTTKRALTVACEMGNVPIVDHVIVAPKMRNPHPLDKEIFSMREEYGSSMFVKDRC